MARDGDKRRGSGGGRGRGGKSTYGPKQRDGGGSGNGNGNGSGPGRKPTVAVPANWPPNITYLTTPFYAGLSPGQRQLLQMQQPGGGDNGRSGGGGVAPLPEIPSILRFGPSPLVTIQTITDPAHPACGQRGLFAARALAPGSFIVPYLGVYHRGSATGGGGGGGGGGTRSNHHAKQHEDSDYDLWLDRVADVAVDAARRGNEARFVNDYRGTGRPRPNAEFREVWDPRRGERGMAVFVLPASRRKRFKGPGVAAPNMGSSRSGGGIAAGEEILVSYGKGFWEMRQKESDETKAAAPPETKDAAATSTTTQAAAETPATADPVADNGSRVPANGGQPTAAAAAAVRKLPLRGWNTLGCS
ncbi:SET domain protein [Niveomyces insectorum RCEF 264]|uniref:SET domain protein n=1 Tax=Niveomyces insectorum RCEF 264 TaxID=1081102 RepID=A0A167VP27_9HYPO|nr:SET domain protein [Niveomyces insectorum RCEF 264]